MALRRRTGKRARWLVDLRNMASCDVPDRMYVSKGHTIYSTALPPNTGQDEPPRQLTTNRRRPT